ncbi:unnamed protein product [Ceutorhynchus assimilis]|uniref:Uncharacterized protein n=1 Tax=Ceutorhynchus assimilis TaxID=467358 RepID=A0A9N9MZC4_9CUCU|nr:unnamed protein product [Ceutorhynchus assimilis]
MEFCHLAAERAKEEGVVCPEILRKNIFTVAAIDNIDHNPSSTTSESSFHGTALSVFQLPNLQSHGEKRLLQTMFSTVQKSGRRSLPSLPDCFTVVPLSRNNLTNPDNSNVLWREGENWLSYVSGEFHSESPQSAVYKDVSWSAFHAAGTLERSPQQSIRAVLPLFDELSSSVSMLRHGMNLVHQLTVHLNEQQVPVLVADQPLYATCKLIQWNWPDLHRNFVVQKSGKPFSAKAIDQTHEQHNAEIKATGGANGLYQDLNTAQSNALSSRD